MKRYLRLTLTSFIILFLELLLIRLVGTEIRIFAYLSNIILLVIFVGTGLGMLVKKPFSLRLSALLLTVLVLITTTKIFTGITDWLSPLSESFIWFQSDAWSFAQILSGFVFLITLFLLILFIFIPLGQFLGNLFDNTKRTIFAYSLDIGAGLVGMWAFYSLSLINLSPIIGIIIIQIALILLIDFPELKRQIITLCFVTTFITAFAFHIEILPSSPVLEKIWSPYQKLTLQKFPEQKLRPSGYILRVNNIGYMGLLDISNGYKKSVTEEFAKNKDAYEKEFGQPLDIKFLDQYSLPFILKNNAQNILIVGAGGGNDIAGAIRAGVKSIEAVEIDREIVKLGKIYHPEKPYSSPNVKIIIDDGRAYFRQTNKKYDIVIMGLADSHTLTSSLTDLRLDHYLYTKESFEEIKKILKPDGLLFVSFDVVRPWIGQHIGQAITGSFGHQPLIFKIPGTAIFGWAGTVFAITQNEQTLNEYLRTNPDLNKFINLQKINYDGENQAITDNWPYLYLGGPTLPKIHIIIYLLLIAVFLIFRKSVSWKGNFDWQMFFLGAGFLLYEFQNINKTSLLFGNTWLTNLATITAIMLLILLANWLHSKKSISLRLSYIGLILAFLLEIFLPLAVLNNLGFVNRLIFGSLVLNLPLFFSALIFISLFSGAKEKSTAFASNLIGSAAGGTLEIFSFLLGIKMMLFFSLSLYLLSTLRFIKFPNIKFWQKEFKL